jgi:AcrR family transcriptional regulator
MPDARPDGRRLRAVRTRAAIVAALYELVRDGDPAPTAARVAAHAGVALRSIGQHFKSREALLAAVAEHHIARVPAPTPKGKPRALRVRIAAFASTRAEDLERTAPMRRAIAVMPQPSPAVLAGVRRELDRRRAELAQTFAPELGADPHRLDRLDVVTSGPAWDVMRRMQRLELEAATAQLVALIEAVLRQGGPRT